MKLTNKNMRKGFTLVELLVVIAIIAALAAMATPVIMKQQKKAAMTTATSNAKQIFYLLVEFDQEFNSFPDSADTANLGSSGNTSNAVLKQLFLGGYTKSEEIFFAKCAFTKSSDGDVGEASDQYAEALQPGECGFVYLDNQSTSGNTARPILAAPLTESASGLEFDSDTYGGKAIALRIDGSVQQFRIDETTSKAVSKKGDDIFSQANKAWKNGTIEPLYPEPK